MIKYNEPVFGEAEIQAVLGALRKGWLVPGPLTESFEKKVSALFGKRHGLFVNSGSSANLLAFKSLGLKKGMEVITPACTFGTTVNPILEAGLVPVFVDSELGTYQVDVEAVKKAISPKTVALMIPQLVGNLNSMRELSKLARNHKLIFIEDSCDTIGGTFEKKPTGHWSDITTTSFYASHLITSGGAGGMFMTNDKTLLRRAQMLRSWGRSIPFYWEDVERRFNTQVNGVDFDGKFVFSELGYNFIPTEMQAAFGLAQLKKLKTYFRTRQKNFKRLFRFFKTYEHLFYLPRELPGTNTAWLAFPLTLKPDAPFSRKEIVMFLEHHGIQTRPLFTGNILHHPAYRTIPHRTVGALNNADYILQNSFLVGLHHGMTDTMVDTMTGIFRQFL